MLSLAGIILPAVAFAVASAAVWAIVKALLTESITRVGVLLLASYAAYLASYAAYIVRRRLRVWAMWPLLGALAGAAAMVVSVVLAIRNMD